MQNVTLRVQRTDRIFYAELIDDSTGRILTTFEIDGPQLGKLALDGECHARAEINFTHAKTPTRLERTEHVVEVGMMPLDKLACDRYVTELLRPYERNGWKGNARHVADPSRTTRTLPSGHHMRLVEFERWVPDVAPGEPIVRESVAVPAPDVEDAKPNTEQP